MVVVTVYRTSSDWFGQLLLHRLWGVGGGGRDVNRLEGQGESESEHTLNLDLHRMLGLRLGLGDSLLWSREREREPQVRAPDHSLYM